MKFNNTLFLILIFSLFFTGCSYKTEQTANMTDYSNISYKANINKSKTYFLNELNQNDINKDELEEINEKLFSVYNQWKGTKYKLGGTTKKGIDCSAFVQKVLKLGFDLSMPRDTISLSKIGTSIEKDELKTGDLVFFKTKRTRHVGIYLEDGKFMHASTKWGVSISEIDSDYFKNKYWKAQRIFD